MLTDTKITWDALQALIKHTECGGSVSLDTCDALGDEIVRCEVLQNGGLYRQLLCLRLFERGNGWAGWKSVEAWLGVKLGLPYKTANERLRVARSLARLPKIDEAFREGLLSYTKVRALHNVATPQNEDTLLETARWASGEQLHRLLAPLRASVKRAKSSQGAREQERAVHFYEHSTEDLVEVHATLLPEEAAALRKALEVGVELGIKAPSNRPLGPLVPGPLVTGGAGSSSDQAMNSAAAELPRERFGFADALVFLAESFLANPPRAGVPAGRRELLIHTVPDLSSGVLETGGSLSAETVRRLACDGATVVVERGREGEVLDVGRRTRRLTRHLEHALLVRDRCCRFPGCTRVAMLDAHHIKHWVEGGETKLSNLVRLCRTHHRSVHEGKWTVRRDTDGEIGFLDPRGREVDRSGRLPQVEAVEAYATLWTECQARGLDSDPEQLTALGRGEAIPDYSYATSVLSGCCGFEPDPDHRDEPAPAVRWLLKHNVP